MVSIDIVLGRVSLAGDLTIPTDARGLVLFAHGSGSSRKSPRNRLVASALQRAGIGTLLFDLLTIEEEELDAFDGHLRFDIELLADRLGAATDWVRRQPALRDLGLGYFGASTGAAAALVAAADRRDIRAIVSRGGRPDLAGDALGRVTAPTLLIVGSDDTEVLALNRSARARMLSANTRLEVVEGATHLFEEPGTLEQVADLAAQWFQALSAELSTKEETVNPTDVDLSEAEETVECIDCGATISPEVDRAYAITSEAFLCYDCAVRRGGVYDDLDDRWTTAPDVSDEPEQRLDLGEFRRAPHRPAAPEARPRPR